MRVKILKDGPYSAFHNLGGFTKASVTWREVGDVVDYPVWYAESLVESDLAVRVPEVIDRATAEIVWPVAKPLDVDATNGARRLASELDIDLTGVEGTGKDGRIITSDVRKVAGEVGD